MRRLLRALRRAHVTCEEATFLASAGLDQPLPISRRWQLRLHLFICKWCRRYLRQIELLRHFTRRAAELSVAEASLSLEARERIRTVLRAAR
jgi:hypothetical protein